MRAYSEDLRQRIVEVVEDGKHPGEVAGVFRVSLASVKRFVKQRREQGHLRSKSPPGRPRTLSAADERLLAQQVKAYKDASLQEHTELLNKATGHEVSLMTVHRTLVRLGITRKKDASAERAR
jgi:transposase